MKKILIFLFYFLLTISTVYIFYKLNTDESFLSSIRYRYYGFAATKLGEIVIENIDDTLFYPKMKLLKREFIMVKWSGDTLRKLSLPIPQCNLGPPKSAYNCYNYDSAIIHIRPIEIFGNQIIPLSVGVSNLIVTVKDRDFYFCDTMQLCVRSKGNRYVIEKNQVVPD
jgi:hypothetical protein